LETVIKSRIPGLQSLINKTIAELEAELGRLGKPIASDAGVSIFFFFLVFNVYNNKIFGGKLGYQFSGFGILAHVYINARCLF
jgi:hypothetical protein